MNSTKTLLATALLSAMTATPLFAQAAIQEPGEFSFYHPNLDVLNGGAPSWTSPHASQPPQAMEDYSARESGIAAHAARSYQAYAFSSHAHRGRSRR
jgi:hypothetical protein